jgi:hypothetical protein
MNLLSGLRIFIGLLFLSFGCLLDFSLYGGGTILRFFCGLIGAFLIVGNSNYGLGYIIGMVTGLIGYTWAIRSGSLSVFDVFYIEGFAKYSIRMVCAFLFILGLKDVKEG